MTVIDVAPQDLTAVAPRPVGSGPDAGHGSPPLSDRPEGGRRTIVIVWVVSIAFGFALVLYGLGPGFQEREQRARFDGYVEQIDQAANAGLFSTTDTPTAPEFGDSVAVLEIGDLRLQQVVVEGVSSSETRIGPGHVPGTAGLMQPGNSVVVGRRGAFGGVFSDLRDLSVGAQIVVATTQGQRVYVVDSVGVTDLTSASAEDGSVGAARTFDEVYGPTENDRLTLVTSASRRPWNRAAAVVVTATMQGAPVAPTPQNGRSDDQRGVAGERSAIATATIGLAVLGLALAASVLLYRRFIPRTAYLLSAPVIVATTVIAAESLSRILPAWL